MSLLQWLRNKSGIDTRASSYVYGDDPVLGYTSTRKHAERWVNSTCGYCSVGCGMQLGVREGRVVSVRGNPDHPVNRGALCPKGLAEHYAIEAEGRALHPMLRINGALTRVNWNDALSTMADRFRAIQQKHGDESIGVISTGQLVTEEFYTLGKLVSSACARGTTTATQRYACRLPSPATSGRSAAMVLRALTKISKSPM